MTCRFNPVTNLSNDLNSIIAKANANIPNDFASTFHIPVIIKTKMLIRRTIPAEKELHCNTIPPIIFQLYVVSLWSVRFDCRTSGRNLINQTKTVTFVARNIVVPNIEDIKSQSSCKFPTTRHPSLSLPKAGIKTICYNMLEHGRKCY